MIAAITYDQKEVSMNTNVINSANYGTGDRPTRHWAMSSHRSTGTAACQYLLMTLLSLMMLLGCLPAFGQADWGNITWSTGVPPGGYLSDDEKKDADTGQVFVNLNPALDFDLANDGKKNTWRIDIEIERGKPPKSFSPTDAKGGTVFLVGVPDPKADPGDKEFKGPQFLGYGRDHFSPRFATNFGAKPRVSVELGRCVYRDGLNTWQLDFKDANKKNGKGEEIAAQWLKSRWMSLDSGATSPTFLQRTFFVADLTEKIDKIVLAKTLQNPPPAGPSDLADLYVITNMQVKDLGPQATDELPSPEPSDPSSVTRQTMLARPLLEDNALSEINQPVFVGEPFTLYGAITNNDQVSHTFYFALAGVNATVSGAPTPLLIGPNETVPYTLQVAALQQGWLGIGVFVWSDALTLGDGAFDAIVVHTAEEER
jgi:hypothetical protein